MSKRVNKPVFVRTRDENGNYVTLNMNTGTRKVNQQIKQSIAINKPQRKWSVKRTLKPGEQVFTDWRTGKKTVFTPRRAEVSSDNRSEYQRQEDQKTADMLHQKHEQEKTTEEGLRNLEAIGKVASPSTYLGPLAKRIKSSIQGDKQDSRAIIEQVLSGEGTGSTSGNLLLDFTGPYIFSKLPKAASSINQFMLPITERIIGKTPFRGAYLSSFLNKAPSINDYGKFYRTNFIDQNLYFKGPSEFKSMVGRRGYTSQPVDVSGPGFVPKDDAGSVFLYDKNGKIKNSDGTVGDMFSLVNDKLNEDGTLKRIGITKNFDRNDIQWYGVERSVQPEKEYYIHGETNKRPVKIDSNLNLQPKPSFIEGAQPKVWSQSNSPYGKNYSRYIISQSDDYNGELSNGIGGFRQNNFRVTDNLPLKNATMFEYDPTVGSFFNNKFAVPKPNFYYSRNTKQLHPSDFFKSELDWTPQSWFGLRSDRQWTKADEDALASHLNEYLNIERESKQNGTWLKNEDGSTWTGDPRSWVQMQSDSFKKNYNNEVLTHGENAINDLFGDFYDDGVGAGIGGKILWTSTNKSLGKTYGNDVFSLVAPKNIKANVVADAGGRPWNNVISNKDTNSLIYPNLTNDNIVRINNVVDVGPNIKLDKINDFYQNETVPEYLARKYTGDDVVLGQDVSRKSIVGNNGNFDPTDKNIYKALIPLIIGSSAYGASNFNSGKDIHIKPSKRGTFTKAAKAHGMSVQGFANKVLKNPSKYSTAMRKKANFARNASKWKH